MFSPETLTVTAAQDLTDVLTERTTPLLIKGLLESWEAIKVNQENALDYLSQLAAQELVFVNRNLEGTPRFFYTADLKDKNFSQSATPFPDFLAELGRHSEQTGTRANPENQASYAYMASTSVQYCMPHWLKQNPLSLNVPNPLISAWLGTQSVAATHFDIPQNLACNAYGRRRFTLFPPEQIANLYVGPIDFTPAGQPVSLVDVNNPDFSRFPKYKTALNHAYQVTLEPGDAIFIPSMWWHNVEALDSVNLLINYWWQTTPAYAGQPMDAIKHALLSVKALSKTQKQAWLNMLEHWLLSDEVDYIPEDVRGSVGELDEKTARRLRAELLKNLNR